MDNDITTEDLDRLDAIAAAATQGIWHTTRIPEDEGNACIKHEHHDVCRIQFSGQEADTVNVGCWLGEEADAVLIAAANPQTILTLTKAVRERDAEIARLRGLVEAAFREAHGRPSPLSEGATDDEWERSDAKLALKQPE